MRAVFNLRIGFAGQVVDLVLTFFGTLKVLSQRHRLLAAVFMGRSKTQQTGDFFFVGEIFSWAFFHDLTEVFPEALIFFRLVLRQFFKHV